ncbi:SWIB/MDM2 domain-containing protein [Baffinella frigidus]|nr:SWIB/MDM2 domain-containing protein [Cryptophyta sp. CCMP2293]
MDEVELKEEKMDPVEDPPVDPPVAVKEEKPVAVKEEKMVDPKVRMNEDETMKDALREILATANLEEFTKKQARRQLEKALGKEEGSLEEMKAKIGEWVDTLMQEKEAAAENEEAEEEEEEEEAELKPRRVKVKKEKKEKKAKKSSGEEGEDGEEKKEKKKGGFAELYLKPVLAEFTGLDKCKRTEVVRLIWKHVKENNLQDEKDKRFIVIDDKLRPLFGSKKRVHMFSMNKDLTKHFGEKVSDMPPEVDDAEESDEAGSEGDDSPAPAKAKAKASRAKAPAASKKKKRDGDGDAPPAKKRKAGGGFTAEVGLSEELGALLGTRKLARTQVVKGLWEYIKGNNLQNPANKMQIIPDKKMERVFGKDIFTGFSMMKLLTPHITKLEKPEWKLVETL